MKKLFAILLMVALLLTLAACGNSGGDSSPAAGGNDTATDGETPDEPVEGGDETPVEGLYEGDGYKIAIPEGWDQTEQMGALVFTPPDYPENANNITVALGEKDAGFSSYAQADFEGLYESIFEEVTFSIFEHTTVGGQSAIYMAYDLSISGMTMTQYQYLVDAPNSTITFTFTQASDEDITGVMSSAMNSLIID